MLQVIISPAKQMQVARDGFAPRGIPPLSEKTAHVMDALRTIEREQGSEGLQALWGVNDKLLAENLERLHSYRDIADANFLGDAELSRLVSPAIFSYVGIQFRSMAPDVLDDAALEWLQGHLWVLSALYGCVRPCSAVSLGDGCQIVRGWGEESLCVLGRFDRTGRVCRVGRTAGRCGRNCESGQRGVFQGGASAST